MSTDIIIAQLIGTLGCGIAAGGIGTLSLICIPGLTLPARSSSPGHSNSLPETPIPHLAHQWLDSYDRGNKIFPGICTISSFANGYLAWALKDVPAPGIICGSWTSLYIAAVALNMGIVVFTLLVMKGTNDRLRDIAERNDAAKDKEVALSDREKAQRAEEEKQVPVLLQKWTGLNICRAAFPFAGAVVSFYGSVWLK
ncbi:hypothetical protein N7495_005800 [Penicillium taxi]|uniref:uncharacterized protein n=1 Tax=Penicillium taxi TaxID=168475 RepID=UPI002545610D|nr:uncharacterized protein N7495_005800 [Penicillium taxi]KAJ5894109.1 hypothetical protein N7495_005800 [Penicillium taxi]